MALVTGRQLSKGADELIHVALGGGKTGFRSSRNGTTEAPWPALKGFENQGGLSCPLWVEGIQSGILGPGASCWGTHLGIKWCHGLNGIPQHSYAEMLTPRTSECDSAGDRASKEVS